MSPSPLLQSMVKTVSANSSLAVVKEKRETPANRLEENTGSAAILSAGAKFTHSPFGSINAKAAVSSNCKFDICAVNSMFAPKIRQKTIFDASDININHITVVKSAPITVQHDEMDMSADFPVHSFNFSSHFDATPQIHRHTQRPTDQKLHPLYIPEILTHIFSFLDNSFNINNDPMQPIDFVKVDSIKYTITKPKLHNCVLVSKLWNACATKMLWKNIRVGSTNGCNKLARTLGPDYGQMRKLTSVPDHKLSISSSIRAQNWNNGFLSDGNIQFSLDLFTERATSSLRFLPSSVNGWIYGEIIKTFTLLPPHGPDNFDFDNVDVDMLISLIALSCPKLEELNLSSCSRVTDKSMVLIAKNCPRLQKLNLNRCDMISSVTVSALAQYCTELVMLNLSRPLLEQKTTISDDSIFQLVSRSKNLMELRLRNCDMITDRTVIAMSESSGECLRALDLSWCGKLTDSSIIKGISRYCRTLTSLAMNGCKKLTDISIACLLSECPTIGSLSLAHLPCISDSMITDMADRLKCLTILSLNGCNNVSDSSVIAIANNCPNLQSLSLFALGITDTALQSLSKGCPYLVSLSISGCTQVTDEGATTISSMTALQSLYLNAANISDRSIIAISGHCRSIRALSLNDCRELTDRSIIALSKYCTQLQSLSMNGCSITAVSIKALIDRCLDLRELSVRKCRMCILEGESAKKVVSGNGGMQHLTAIGEQVLAKIRKRRIALILRED